MPQTLHDHTGAETNTSSTWLPGSFEVSALLDSKYLDSIVEHMFLLCNMHAWSQLNLFRLRGATHGARESIYQFVFENGSRDCFHQWFTNDAMGDTKMFLFFSNVSMINAFVSELVF